MMWKGPQDKDGDVKGSKEIRDVIQALVFAA